MKDHASMQTRHPEAKNQARDHQEKSVKCEEMTLDCAEKAGRPPWSVFWRKIPRPAKDGSEEGLNLKTATNQAPKLS